MPLVIIISIIIAVIIGLVVLVIMLLPWMDRWGCTDAEIASGLPGDDLVPDPPRVTNRAVSINTSREAIFPGWRRWERINQACTVTPGWKTWSAARWQKWRRSAPNGRTPNLATW